MARKVKCTAAGFNVMESETAGATQAARVSLPWAALAAVVGLALGAVLGTLAAEVPEEFYASGPAQWVAAILVLTGLAVLAWREKGSTRLAMWLAATLTFMPFFVAMGV